MKIDNIDFSFKVETGKSFSITMNAATARAVMGQLETIPLEGNDKIKILFEMENELKSSIEYSEGELE